MVICVFQHAFGDQPHNGREPVWLEKQAALLDAELQIFDSKQHKWTKKSGKNLQGTFYQNAAVTKFFKLGLVKFLNEAIRLSTLL